MEPVNRATIGAFCLSLNGIWAELVREVSESDLGRGDYRPEAKDGLQFCVSEANPGGQGGGDSGVYECAFGIYLGQGVAAGGFGI